ncbi:hypothetical protein NDU88_010210 [Pleurodeles waltl]|uniref:Uncharacterized protein n=1 Tax=Pleurodeles waltl TaxID=8319 RepID=A0AAV7RXI4_PLEWA|nr:hypothetical protein NDU88_010210 [Pleurodeles waltl]
MGAEDSLLAANSPRTEDARKHNNKSNKMRENNYNNVNNYTPMAGMLDFNMKQLKTKEYSLFAKGKVVSWGHFGSLHPSDIYVLADSQTPIIGLSSEVSQPKAVEYQVLQSSSSDPSKEKNLQMQLKMAVPSSVQELQHQNVQEDTRLSAQFDIKSMFNIILDEIRYHSTSQAFEIAALHEEAMTYIPDRLQEAESRIIQLEDQVTSMQEEGGAREPDRGLQRFRPGPKAPGPRLPIGCGLGWGSPASEHRAMAPEVRGRDCVPDAALVPAPAALRAEERDLPWGPKS